MADRIVTVGGDDGTRRLNCYCSRRQTCPCLGGSGGPTDGMSAYSSLYSELIGRGSSPRRKKSPIRSGGTCGAWRSCFLGFTVETVPWCGLLVHRAFLKAS